MKKHLHRHLLLSWLIIITAIHTSMAQDFAVVHSSLILSEMPEVATLRSNLQALSSALQKEGQEMVTNYQSKESDASSDRKSVV